MPPWELDNVSDQWRRHLHKLVKGYFRTALTCSRKIAGNSTFARHSCLSMQFQFTLILLDLKPYPDFPLLFFVSGFFLNVRAVRMVRFFTDQPPFCLLLVSLYLVVFSHSTNNWLDIVFFLSSFLAKTNLRHYRWKIFPLQSHSLFAWGAIVKNLFHIWSLQFSGENKRFSSVLLAAGA